MSLGEAAVHAILTSKLHHEDFALEGFEIRQVCADGMMGEHFQLSCTAKLATAEDWKATKHNFFVKKKATHDYGELPERVFQKERACFEMFKTINIPRINAVLPKYFYSDDQHLVFEDLHEEGFAIQTPGRVATEEELLVVLDSLAMLHTGGIAYEEREKEDNPEFTLLEEFPNTFVELYMNNELSSRYQRAVIRGILTGIKVFDIPQVLKHGKLFNDEVEKMASLNHHMFPSKRFRNTISHGDLWPSNIFIKYDDEGVPRYCKTIDYQIARYYLPAFDVLECIFLNTSREYRQEHLERLKKYYFDKFSKYLREYGIKPEEIYTFEAYLESFKEIELFAHFMTLATIPMVYNVDWGIKELMKSEDKDSIILDDRSPLITNFLDNEYLMGRIKGAILDLKEYFENN